jgi:hypothetical protein
MDSHESDRDARPLAEIDADLAERFVIRLVDRFLAGAGLSASHRTEAISQTGVFVIVDGDESRKLEVALPLVQAILATPGMDRSRKQTRLPTTPRTAVSKACSGIRRTFV